MLTNVSFNGSTSSSDGGILESDHLGNAALTDVTVASGTAANHGGGIMNLGNLTLNRVTFNDNTATNVDGGALENYFGSVAITNTTFARNHAPSGTGGAIFGYAGPITLTNVTIANNSASTAGGIDLFGSTIALKNTILYGNPNGNCGSPPTSLGNNLDGGNTCAFSAAGDITSTNPLLGPLADNGGLTQTRALLAGSPAINHGTDSGCPITDQRGYPRLSPCDIGAFEYMLRLFLPLIRR
jgi:predicted outer membrane repeat protein